jgi:uncharacterized damage-inducible protein DinB
MTTLLYVQTWAEARIRFENLLNTIEEKDLTKRLSNTKNSAGFLIRHVGDVELLFAKNVFGLKDLKVHAKTVVAQRDTGEWTNLRELLDYQQEAHKQLRAVLEGQSDEAWTNTVTTKEFGTKTEAEALGRIMSHTAYHAGQLALTLKYG